MPPFSLTSDGYIPTRDEIHTAALGLIAQTYRLSPGADTGGDVANTLTSQAVFGASVGLRAGDIVSSIAALVTTAASGTTPTTVRLGLADSTGVMLARTGNVNTAAAWAAGFKTFALGSAYTVPSDGLYYLCVVKNGTFGTTEPVVLLSAAPAGVLDYGKALGSNPVRHFTWTAQTDLPALAAALTLTTQGAYVWLGAVGTRVA